MRKSFYFLSFFGAALLLTGVSCFGGGSNIADGGVFKSSDKGTTWASKAALMNTQGAKLTFAQLDVNALAMDPSDHNAIWAGTMTGGILYTFDGGEGWQVVREPTIRASRVNGIAIDPTNSCVVYATITTASGASSLVRTTNCGRSWKNVLNIELKDQQYQAIAINPKNPLEVFIGDSAGDLFRSDNAGGTWAKMTRFEGFNVAVRAIIVNPKNPKIVYAGTKLGGLYKSDDGGFKWRKLDLKKFKGADDVYQIVMDPSGDDTLLIGTHYGILRSEDGGATWNAFELLTAPFETQIISLAVNPKDPREIYYGTAKTFYRSSDGGKNWTTKKVPTSRVLRAIAVDPTDPNNLWLAAWNSPQQ